MNVDAADATVPVRWTYWASTMPVTGTSPGAGWTGGARVTLTEPMRLSTGCRSSRRWPCRRRRCQSRGGEAARRDGIEE